MKNNAVTIYQIHDTLSGAKLGIIWMHPTEDLTLEHHYSCEFKLRKYFGSTFNLECGSLTDLLNLVRDNFRNEDTTLVKIDPNSGKSCEIRVFTSK